MDMVYSRDHVVMSYFRLSLGHGGYGIRSSSCCNVLFQVICRSRWIWYTVVIMLLCLFSAYHWVKGDMVYVRDNVVMS